MITIARVYDDHSKLPGKHFLVERLWPRGVRKEELSDAEWLKDVAPSTELRKWFEHDPAKWPGFESKYREELNAKPNTWKPLADAAKSGDIVLLYSARDTEHNSAVVLKDYIENKL